MPRTSSFFVFSSYRLITKIKVLILQWFKASRAANLPEGRQRCRPSAFIAGQADYRTYWQVVVFLLFCRLCFLVRRIFLCCFLCRVLFFSSYRLVIKIKVLLLRIILRGSGQEEPTGLHSCSLVLILETSILLLYKFSFFSFFFIVSFGKIKVLLL